MVDDGSTDHTPALLQRYANDSRVRVIRQENQGAVAAARVGFAAARGAYVGLLDQDDAYELRFLAETVARFDADPDLDYVYTDYVETYQGVTRRVDVRDLFLTIVCNAVYRRSSIEKAGYWRDVFFAEYDLLLRTYGVWKCAHVDLPLTTYFRRSESLTADSARVEAGIAELMDLHPDKHELIKRIRSYELLP